VVTLNRAVAVSKVQGAGAALAMIEPLEQKLGGYFYFHGARGEFLLELGREAEARDAFNHAIALANTPAEAAHMRDRIDRLTAEARQAEPRG
jgi:RNA polymerase sigma-70 factor, ECF subfamily